MTWNGALIARDMALRGWSQVALAKAATTKRRRVTEATISRLITGSGYVAPPLAAKVAAALGQPLDRYLLDVQQESDLSPFVQQSSGEASPLKISA